MNNFSDKKKFAAKLDSKDTLAPLRKKFLFPVTKEGKKKIYFCGNSLGLQPKRAEKYVKVELQDWKEKGVEGHFDAHYPWRDYHEFLADPMSRIVGASIDEIVVMGSLTTNLHLLMVSFYRPEKKRWKIMIEGDAFPSDRYAVHSQIKFHGYDADSGIVELRNGKGNPILSTDEILAAIEKYGSETAMILLGAVNYYSGQAFEIEKIAKAAAEKGIILGLDLAHAAGNILLKLHDWNVDFAAWCGYKYLNGGPGGVAGLFVHEKHVKNPDLPKFAGWWGHDKTTRFKMGPNFKAIPSAESWQLSNAPVLPMAVLRASLELFDEAGMDRLREKSVLLTGYIEFLLQSVLQKLKMEIITPTAPDQRGCQISMRTSEKGREIHNFLSENGVICDWREPDVIRIAPVPLYNSFKDAWNFVELLKNYAAKNKSN